MFGEAAVHLSDWTDKPLLRRTSSLAIFFIFVPICVLMCANDARKFDISQELIEIWMRRKIKKSAIEEVMGLLSPQCIRAQLIWSPLVPNSPLWRCCICCGCESRLHSHQHWVRLASASHSYQLAPLRCRLGPRFSYSRRACHVVLYAYSNALPVAKYLQLGFQVYDSADDEGH